MYRAAKSDIGHLPPLTASSPHSSRTITPRIAAQRNRRNTPTTGKTRMLATRNAQITVCKSLIAINTAALSRLSACALREFSVALRAASVSSWHKGEHPPRYESVECVAVSGIHGNTEAERKRRLLTVCGKAAPSALELTAAVEREASKRPAAMRLSTPKFSTCKRRFHKIRFRALGMCSRTKPQGCRITPPL